MLVHILPLPVQTFIARHDKKMRFLIAGGVNTLVGLSVYPLLYLWLEPLGWNYIKILLLAQVICITFSFISNKYFVFKTKGNIQKEYVKFFLFHGFYLALNLVCLPVLVEKAGINPIISQTLFSIAIIISSYFWHNFITFKKIKGS
jgi:putative flippase GtrA